MFTISTSPAKSAFILTLLKNGLGVLNWIEASVSFDHLTSLTSALTVQSNLWHFDLLESCRSFGV